MKKNIKITVPKPCHEKWNSFTKTSNGGFCASCQKDVIDFTSWSEERIKFYFKNTTGNTCGHFRQDQLKIYSFDSPSRSRIKWITLLFAGLLLLLNARQVSAQAKQRQTTEQYQPEERNEYLHRAKPATVTIIGTVTSREEGQVMPGVKVVLKGTWNETLTDAEGKFKLQLPNKDSSQFIVFSFKGFNTLEYLHNVTRPSREIAVDMTPRVDPVTDVLVGVLGGAVAVYKWDEPKEIARDAWWWLTRR